jgi:hypothetical protein
MLMEIIDKHAPLKAMLHSAILLAMQFYSWEM